MPFEPPTNNTRTANSEDLYLLKTGGTIDGNVIVDGTVNINGDLTADSATILDVLNVNDSIITPTIIGAPGSVAIPVSFPSGVAINSTIYSAVTAPFTGPFAPVPLTFTPPLPVPSASNAGVYLVNLITNTATVTPGVNDVISQQAIMVNNGKAWTGGNPFLAEAFLFPTDNVGSVPPTGNGLPLLLSRQTTPITVTVYVVQISLLFSIPSV